jgi:hypothetical protein
MALIDLYTKKSDDDVYLHDSGNGFGLITDYPEGMEKHKVIVKLSVESRKLKGSVNLVKEASTPSVDVGYEIETKAIKNKPYTNFWFDVNDGFIFDDDKEKIISNSGKEYAVDDFIALLLRTHASDVFWVHRKLIGLKLYFLKSLFFLVNEELEDNPLMLYIKHERNELKQRGELDEDPFYKYFKISKNIVVLAFLLLVLIFTGLYLSGDKLDYPNILVFIYAILGLFTLEKISSFIRDKIQDFYDNKENFISRIYKEKFEFHKKFDFEE